MLAVCGNVITVFHYSILLPLVFRLPLLFLELRIKFKKNNNGSSIH